MPEMSLKNQALRMALINRSALVAQPVQGLAQRSAPLLIPTDADASVASAVAFPPTEVVTATPCRLLDDLHVVPGRILGQELRVVRGAHQLSLVDVVDRVGN